MNYMKANDDLDRLFSGLQDKLNSTEVAPCETPARGYISCLSHDWGSARGGRPRFFYGPDAAEFVNKNFCAPCKASWYVAVARNLMLGITG